MIIKMFPITHDFHSVLNVLWTKNISVLILFAALSHRYGVIIPHVQGVYLGGAATLFCNSAKLAYWFHNKTPIKPLRFANTIFIRKASYHNEGVYTCAGTYPSGLGFVAHSYVFVGGN